MPLGTFVAGGYSMARGGSPGVTKKASNRGERDMGKRTAAAAETAADLAEERPALAEPSPPVPSRGAAPADARTQVGRPVQFWYPQGQGDAPPVLAAGVLLGPSRTSADLWNVEVAVPHAAGRVVKAGCRYSDEPRAGCWRHIPEE